MLRFCVIVIFLATPPSDASRDCDYPYSCSNETIIEDTIVLDGYKSAYGFIYDNNDAVLKSEQLYIFGAYAAQYVSYVSWNSSSDPLVAAEAGFANISLIETTPNTRTTLLCRASLGCIFSTFNTFNSDNTITCDADSSCFNNVFISPTQIDGYGSHSLKDSVIIGNSTINKQMIINLYGFYAGYNTIILCDDGMDVCIINCFGNGCFNLRHSCMNASLNCNFTINCNESSQIICPIDLNVENSIESIILNNSISNFIDTKYDFSNYETSLQHEQNCNIENQSLRFDNTSHSDGSSILTLVHSNGNICCRGRNACGAGLEGLVVNNGNIICNAFNPCTNMENITVNSGNAGNIVCSGLRACYRSNLYLKIPNGSIYCTGYRSCELASLHGISSISNSNNNYNVLYCAAVASCSDTEVYGISQVFITSEVTEDDASMNIYSRNCLNLDVYLMSYHSGYNIFVNCDSENDTCNVYCLTDDACATNKTLVDCTVGWCNIFCNQTMNIGCPTIIGSNYNIYTDFDALSMTTTTNTFEPTSTANTAHINNPTGHEGSTISSTTLAPTNSASLLSSTNIEIPPSKENTSDNTRTVLIVIIIIAIGMLGCIIGIAVNLVRHRNNTTKYGNNDLSQVPSIKLSSLGSSSHHNVNRASRVLQLVRKITLATVDENDGADDDNQDGVDNNNNNNNNNNDNNLSSKHNKNKKLRKKTSLNIKGFSLNVKKSHDTGSEEQGSIKLMEENDSRMSQMTLQTVEIAEQIQNPIALTSFLNGGGPVGPQPQVDKQGEFTMTQTFFSANSKEGVGHATGGGAHRSNNSRNNFALHGIFSPSKSPNKLPKGRGGKSIFDMDVVLEHVGVGINNNNNDDNGEPTIQSSSSKTGTGSMLFGDFGGSPLSPMNLKSPSKIGTLGKGQMAMIAELNADDVNSEGMIQMQGTGADLYANDSKNEDNIDNINSNNDVNEMRKVQINNRHTKAKTRAATDDDEMNQTIKNKHENESENENENENKYNTDEMIGIYGLSDDDEKETNANYGASGEMSPTQKDRNKNTNDKINNEKRRQNKTAGWTKRGRDKKMTNDGNIITRKTSNKQKNSI